MKRCMIWHFWHIVIITTVTTTTVTTTGTPHTTEMDLKGKAALFPYGKTTVDVIDVATGEVIQQHDAQGTHYIGGASIQENIAAMSVSEPQHGVHVMDIKSGKMLCKFEPPDGQDVSVALSKDAFTLVVGSDTGM